jgi:hypothetical protein
MTESESCARMAKGTQIKVTANTNTLNKTYCVVLHPLEDASAGEDGTDNDTKTRLCKDNVESTPCSVSSISNSDTNVGLLKSWGIVDTVPSHTNNVLLL